MTVGPGMTQALLCCFFATPSPDPSRCCGLRARILRFRLWRHACQSINTKTSGEFFISRSIPIAAAPMSSSPVGSRRRRRDRLQMDYVERVYAQWRAHLIHTHLISNRSRKRARVAASSDGLQEVRPGDAGIRMPAECAVCLEDFVAEDRLRAMPCSHTFHHDCILRWLRVNRVCPLCRHALPTQLVDDQDQGYNQGNSQPDEILDEYHRHYYDDDYEREYNRVASMPVQPEQESA